MRIPRDQLDNKIGRLSRDKVGKLAHSITDALAALDEVEFKQEHNSVRLEVKGLLQKLLEDEAKLDQQARDKIEHQRRTILEGSAEYEILYRKYYLEEVKKLGI